MSSLTAMYLSDDRPVLTKWPWRTVPSVMELWVFKKDMHFCTYVPRLVVGMVVRRVLMAVDMAVLGS